jgi:hypothetical protein
VKHSIVFPNLETVLVPLVEGLWSEKWRNLGSLLYFGMIEMCGGKTAVLDVVRQSIPDEIKKLGVSEYL